MESKASKIFLVLFIIAVTLLLGTQLLWAAKPATTQDPPKSFESAATDPGKKETPLQLRAASIVPNASTTLIALAATPRRSMRGNLLNPFMEVSPAMAVTGILRI